MNAALRRFLALVAGPGLGLGAALWAAPALGLPAAAALGVTVWCAAWWVLEPVPIVVASLLPFVLLPALGVADQKAVGGAWGHPLILLLMGGFMLSTALEASGAHRRLALGLVRLVGGRGPRGLVLGFMVATAACSMWISNAATALMMMPVATAALQADAARRGGPSPIAAPLLLGVAYAASIGGIGTPVGTPPNVIFMGVLKEMTGETMGFAQWMKLGVPVVLLFIPLAWAWLVRRVGPGAPIAMEALPPWTSRERRVVAVFALVAAAWIFQDAPGGGWRAALGADGAGESTVALAGVLALLALPAGDGAPLLRWGDAARIPWDLLLLFAGGIAIARAFETTGLATAVGGGLVEGLGLAAWPPALRVAAIALAVTFLTEVTSNTALTTLLMPVLAAAGVAAGLPPAELMLPAAMSASCAFMLPVATAPNAIVCATGEVRTAVMAREGFGMNLIGVAVITGVVVLLG